MTKKTKKPTRLSRRERLLTSIKSHPGVTALVILALLVVGLVIYDKISDYRRQYSEQDFMGLSEQIEGVFRAAGGESVEIVENNNCGYFSGKYDFTEELYCRIDMAAYMPYKSDEQARTIAKEFQKRLSSVGRVTSYLSGFIAAPSERSDTVTVILPPRSNHCNFHIASQSKAKRNGTLPERPENDLIALHAQCSAESRGQYFPLRD